MNLKSNQQKINVIDYIKKTDNFHWRQAIRQDGKIGILVEPVTNEQDKISQDNYMIITNEQGQLQAMSCSSIRMKWQVCKQQSSNNSEIIQLVKNQKGLSKRFRQTTPEMKNMTILDNVSTVGGSLGKCLANIEKYKNTSDFMIDLSRNVAVSGTFNYLISNVPLIGYLFVTGGYSYSFYAIFKNKFSNGTKKMQEIGNVTLGTASSISSGILGAVIGQTFIPVPIIGAFVGGVIGGLVGQVGSKALLSWIQSARFRDTIKCLKQNMQSEGCWCISEVNLKIIGLNFNNFYETIPEQLQYRYGCDKLWLTLICFSLLCFRESRLRNKFVIQQCKKLEANRKKYEKQSNEDFIINIKQNQQYQNSGEINQVYAFLKQQNISLLKCYEELEQFILKMFTRIN